MLLQQQESFAQQKKDLELKLREAEKRTSNPEKYSKRAEEAIAEERSLREDLERTLQIVMQERDVARNDLLTRSLKENLSKEEFKSLEEQKKLLREEMEKLKRNAESALREQRASEKRFQAMTEELKQLMEERDTAIMLKDEARKEKALQEELLMTCKKEIDEVKSINNQLTERLLNTERIRDHALSQKQSEERLRLQCQADVEVIRQQVHTLQVERDAALRENETILERLDQALGARRLAIAAKGEAIQQAEEFQRKCEQAEIRLKGESKRAEELDQKLRDSQELCEKLRNQLEAQQNQLLQADLAVQEYREYKEEAERECEAARRQVRGLNDEMLSVLKARDLALQQRDDALTKNQPRLLTDTQRIDSSSGINYDELLEVDSNLRKLLLLLEVDSQDLKNEDLNWSISRLINKLRLDSSRILNLLTKYKEKSNITSQSLRVASQQIEDLLKQLEDLSRRGINNQDNHFVEDQLRQKNEENKSLREERKALYLELNELNNELSRTSSYRTEIENLKEKLKVALRDFDRIETENRRLKGLL